MKHTISSLSKQGIRVLECCSPPPSLFKVIRQELEHDVAFGMPGCLSPQALNKSNLAQGEVEQAAFCRVSFFTEHKLVSGGRLHLSFLRSASAKAATPLLWTTRTKLSIEFNHKKKPIARASFHRTFPPHAAVLAAKRISWLLLWKAHTISRYRIRSRKPRRYSSAE